MKTLKVRLSFTTEQLGTKPADEDIYRNFIADKAPNAQSIEDEIESIGVDGVVERGSTVFSRDKDGKPILWDYQVRGFFKGSCGGLSRVKGAKKGEPGYESTKLRAYKKIIDNLIFVFPREIPIVFDGEVSDCQRPLRAQTAQGERTSLAKSEEIPAGAHIDIDIEVLSDDLLPAVKEWLDFGKYVGISQWRNASRGRFTWAERE
jgi:hypothetical protein